MTDLPEASEVASDDDTALETEPESEQFWTSDAALSFGEARRLTSRRGATVVMLLGEAKTGKTTLLVELWTDLLIHGAVGNFQFAGSTTALAFEERSFESRLQSGLAVGDTLRTNEENDGLLHLSVMNDGERMELLLADVTGEHFRVIREGGAFIDEFDWISRVDRFAVLVDGALVGGVGTAEIAFTRTRRLLFALRDSDLVAPTSRAALIVSKYDALSADARDEFSDRERSLHELIKEIDPTAALIRVSARPPAGIEPKGIDDLLAWVCQSHRQTEVRRPVIQTPERAFGRFQP